MYYKLIKEKIKKIFKKVNNQDTQNWWNLKVSYQPFKKLD